MTPVKQARVIRDWFAREKVHESAEYIIATDASVFVQTEYIQNKKRPEMFLLLIEHEGGKISIPFNSEIMGKWKKEIAEFSHAFWLQGQHLPYAQYGKRKG
jgi:hypothetical protein